MQIKIDLSYSKLRECELNMRKRIRMERWGRLAAYHLQRVYLGPCTRWVHDDLVKFKQVISDLQWRIQVAWCWRQTALNKVIALEHKLSEIAEESYSSNSDL